MPAATTALTQEPNIQNVNPNVIHVTSSTTVTSASSSQNTTTSISTTPLNNNKSQVITQNIHVKSKDDRQQPESIVVSVPLTSATVPGIQLPTTNSSNSSSNNISTVSTIVSNQPPTALPILAATVPPQGSLYQHLTNNQSGSQRVSPLIQQGTGRVSPLTPTPSPLANDNYAANNHTSVLQNMNSSTSSVISSAGFHGTNVETSSSGMLKVSYEKQVQPRVQAIQHEETTRRSR